MENENESSVSMSIVGLSFDYMQWPLNAYLEDAEFRAGYPFPPMATAQPNDGSSSSDSLSSITNADRSQVDDDMKIDDSRTLSDGNESQKCLYDFDDELVTSFKSVSEDESQTTIQEMNLTQEVRPEKERNELSSSNSVQYMDNKVTSN